MSLVSGKADIRDRDVTFEEHLQQVMSIMSWLVRHTAQTTLLSAYIFEFIVMRCYRKLFARLQSGVTLWTEHPLVALRDYYEKVSKTDAEEESPSASAFPHYVKLSYAGLYKRQLTSHGIFPDETSSTDSGTVRYTVSWSTAPAWARLLYDSYSTMSEILSQNGENGLEARRPIDRKQRRSLYASVAMLDDALREGIVETLLQDSLVTRLNRQYVFAMQYKTNPRLASTCYV